MDIKHTVFVGDNLRILPKLKRRKFNLVLTDPPYHLSKPENEGQLLLERKSIHLDKGEWDRVMTPDEQLSYSMEWIRAVKPLIAQDGSLMICGVIQFNLWAEVEAAIRLGFEPVNSIIVHTPNSPPNFRGVRLANKFYEIIWLKRSDEKLTFFHERAKRVNGGKQLGNVWTSHVIQTERLHATQKQTEVMERCILISTNPGDWVLDPFLGSGTTMLASKRQQRNCVGVERGWETGKGEIPFRNAIKKKVDWGTTSILPGERIAYRWEEKYGVKDTIF